MQVQRSPSYFLQADPLFENPLTMSQQSDAVSGACLDVDLSSPAPAEPGRIALPHPADAGAHVLGDGIAAARGGDSEALILMAGGVNEASQVWGNQSRPSSSEFTLGPSVNYSSSSDYSVKVLFDGSSPVRFRIFPYLADCKFGIF